MTFSFEINKESKIVTIERKFEAPRAAVWQAYTTAETLDRWWAPKPFSSRTKEMDFQVGGRRFYAMVSPDGQARWQIQRYTAISPVDHFSFFSAFADEHENPELPGSEWDLTLSEEDGTTLVRISIYNESLERLERMIEMGFLAGIEAQLNGLAEFLTAGASGQPG